MPTPGRRTAATLLDVLLHAAQETPGQVVVHVRGDGSEHTVTFTELRDDALRVAGGLREAGLEPGTPVPLLADRGEDFQPMFWGALAAGLVPVPLAPEARRVGPVWEFLGRPAVVVDDATATGPLLAEIPGAVRAVRLDALRQGRPLRALPRREPQDLAFVQFSSGSTGAPKGVELTHEAVLANLRQIRAAMAITPDDVVASWMPYFHDMGLIGTHLVPMAARLKQIRLEPLTFAKRPARWLEAVDRHRATLLSAANFALALTARRVPDSTWAALDLSCVRLMLVGAEPIAPRVWREFSAKGGAAGLHATAMLPVYGLAEATLAVTVPPLGEIAAPLRLDRKALSRGRAVPAGTGPDTVELMDVGRPVPECELRVTDDAGNPVDDRRVGHIEVRGPQVARGYHRAAEASAAAFRGGWLRTGDLGFLHEGRLCVTGRHKDVVFVGGRTFHAPDLEETVAATPGLPGGTVAAVGSTDPRTGGDRVAVFVQWARPALATALPVLDSAAARVREALGHDDVRVLPLPPGAFPRTTSGKLRRALMRERFAAGAYTAVEERLGAARAEGSRTARGAECGSRGAGPRSRRDVEEAIREIWAQALDLPPAAIGRDDRFLALGGSSLKAMSVLAEIEDAFSVTVEPRDLRDHHTVAALAGHVLALVRETGGASEARRDAVAPPAGEHAGRGPVAVLGMACRFPGANTPEAFWELLLSGRDTLTAVPDDRWDDAPGFFGSFLPDPSLFDAAYFGMDDEDARATDPQARIFLELAHEALERAGYAGPRRTGRRIGVFAAVGDSGYREILAAATDGDLAGHPGALTGNLPNLIAARLSQALDLDGPALAVDTACSSALVALHLARRSLQSGECDVAVVGGVQLALTPTGHRLLERAGALSPTGGSRPFDAAADGIVPGEGGAVLVLTRLDDALRAGDPVLALVRGTAVNNDGRSLSLLAPNPRTQREVITRAYGACGIDPDAVSYVEAHGTGTPVGDPVEAQSLGYAFPPRADGTSRLLGSVKANIGHLLNAAGMPSLVKTVLALQHRRLPPSPHATGSAPYLARVAPGFELVTEQREWRAPGPLIAGVNAFGFGGTNAHAVLEEPPARTPSGTPAPAHGPHLLTLSAHSADALRTAAVDLAAHARTHPEAHEADLCATVNTARDDGPYRLAVIADGDLADRLDAARTADFTPARSRPRTVFLLPGQGAQRPGQGRALYRSAPAFREVLDEASSLTGPIRGRSLAEWCLDPGTDPGELARTEVAQPLLVAFGVGLARQLAEWGVPVDAVAGHSVGEIAAACVAGSLTLDEAVGFAAERGRLVAELALPGTMAAVRGAEDTVAELVSASGGTLSVAAVNAPDQVVVSGAGDAVDRAIAELSGRGVAARRLRVSHAFHSPLLEPVLDALGDAAKALTVKSGTVPMLSTVSGAWQPGLSPAYWQAHAVRPVRFGAAVAKLLEEGYDTFLELGPGNTLGGAVRAVARAQGALDVAVSTTGLPSAAGGDADSSGARTLLETAGRLWTRGAALDRTRTAHAAGRPRVPVPTYPFQRVRHWPRRPDAAPVVCRLGWGDAPLTPAGGPRVVRLAGGGRALGRALAERLTGRGVTVLGDDLAHGPDAASADTVVWLAGEEGAADGGRQAPHTTATTSLRQVLDLLSADCSRLLVVTEDAYVTGASPERAHPIQALPHGFALALPEEHPGLATRSVDLSSRDPLDARVDALERELYSAHEAGAEGAVAWRAGRRVSRTPAHVTDVATAREELPADGTYLITGGAGGLGSALARDLAGRGACELILTGRSARVPDELLAELRAHGARARYQAADVSDEADVDALFATLPPLDGVFHAAGTVRPGTLRAKTDAEIEQVLAAKVRGTALLAAALRRHGQEPAVRVAFSSVSSVLPGLAGALGDYAAANAFLDAFAAAERTAGRPWLAVGFGPVADAGLAAGSPAEARLRARGLGSMTARVAIAGLRTAISTGAAHVLVSSSAAPVAAVVAMDRSADSRHSATRPASPADGTVPDPACLPDPAPLADLIRRLLAEALHRAPEDIGDDEQFLSLGLDSLTAVDLARRLETELGLPLSATLLFEHRTIGELTTHLGAPGPRASRAPATVHRGPAAHTPYPLTPLQRAFLTTKALYEGVTAYGYIRQTVRGPLDPGLLGRALAHLAARHPMLRLRITGNGTPPTQYTAPAEPTDRAPRWYEVHEPDATPPPLSDLEQRLYNRPFDLTTEDPARAVLVRDRRDAHVAHLLLAVHHSAVDGFSLKLLCEELWALYTELAHGRSPELTAPRAEFADYAALDTAGRQSPAFTRDQRYWRDRVAEHTAAAAAEGRQPDLPYDGDPEALPTPPLTHHQTTADTSLTVALRAMAARHEVSLFHLLLAVYGRCLARWSGGQRAVAVNVARARREAPLPGIDRLVGPLADTLPVFAVVEPDEPVTVLARRLRQIWREAEAHATLASPDIAALLPTTGTAPRTVAPAGFSFARFPVSHGQDWPLTVTPTAAATASAATRLGLLCWESDATLHFSWNHPAHLFRHETVERLAGEYMAELRAMADQPALAERDDSGGGIVDRLRARFRAAPGAVAVDTGRTRLTYAELDAASDTLAARLRASGVHPGDLVGLLTEPGAQDTVVGVVGILRAGAGWVPLDPTHPLSRVRDQAKRTGIGVVVCHGATREAVAALDGITPVAVDEPPSAAPSAYDTPPADAAPGPDAIAYVIFTSGSTGRPKAVPITHRSMLNYLDWSLITFGYRPGDRLVQTASVCFDASVRQLLAPLLAGATVHTLTRGLLRDPEALLDLVVNDRITVWSSVPTLWERLLTAAETRVRRNGTPPDLSALRWVHVGGEALPAAHVRRWFDLLDGCGGPEHRISNLYGPTESTINATCHIIDTRPADDVRQLPIGRPVAGTELAVVTEDGRPSAPGEAGELLIAGTGLTPGYLGEPRLTSAAFVERDGRRWYRSGDRVRRSPDGVLEFLGRLDDQVKVRGHRVEPGEVEAALLAHPDIARAAVLLVGGRLVAYAEPRTGSPDPDPREVRAFLSRVLPPYMLPGRIRSIAAIPLTGTGKIDRKLLAASESEGTPGTDDSDGTEGHGRLSRGDAADGHPAQEPSRRRGPGTPPTTPTERTLARIWSALLDVPDVTREDDFFGLGGDSIMVLELFARLREDLPAVPRPTTVYTHRTLGALAAALDSAATEPPPDPAADPGPAQPPGPYPLTPSQRGFLLAEAINPGSGSGWLARFRLRGPLRHDVFQRAVDVLVARHPMLRTVFPAGARPPVQQELPDSLRLPVQTESLAHPDLLEQRIAEEAGRRLEPWAWPLLRLRLFTVAPGEHVLLVHAHHLIGDGFSAALLARELLTAYDRLDRGLPHGLPPLDTTFRDHVTSSSERPQPHGPAAEAYRARLGAPYKPPVLRRPNPESAEPADGQPAYHTSGFTVDAVTTGGLRRLARSGHRTLYAPLLTAYYRALAELTGRRDLMLGLAVTGREESTADAHRVFGPFAEAVALRPALPGGDGRHQRAAFDDDLRRLAAEADLARAAGPSEVRTAAGLPCHAQFFFTFLDFTSLGSGTDGRLTLHADESDTALAPPPLGTDVFLAVRPLADGEGLRVTVRASAAALTPGEVTGFAEEMRRQLREALGETGPAPDHSSRRRPPRLDAALVGYLPAPHHLAALAGVPYDSPGLGREEIRAFLFPDGRARLLEETSTPLGNSGFVALPFFADELGPAGDLAVRTARAVEHAASLGARCVSLAGMIPSLTGYGYDVLREATTSAAITTGHASTTVAVTKTVHTALDATGRGLEDLSLAVVGCGSIGTSSLRLLLATAPRPPARLLLCDLPGSSERLDRLAADLSSGHPAMPVQVAESGRTLPAAVYEADLIVTAVSGATALLDVDRMRPGTIVVDDSFPHCFDTASALDRMSREQDVLVVGGGLLALDRTQTRLSEGLPAVASAGLAVRPPGIPGTMASCRLESLLHAHLAEAGRPPNDLPLTHGLVDLPRALAHWDAVEAAGVRPAPLHLLDRVIAPGAIPGPGRAR
ncbi:hybrid non-ribosomal peptide synthetase/type I polyketide synthase [Streptomyces viridochromogenes]|uniref:hybrid non-ribosomal peptide synthetase/type I polyketide synthase n=1 Tax=Streptomyces viridochromogenes TaxID=1938 RepID=UPI00069E8C9C|nr:hybrid non-ribosomal peptide synthetase/type I polyketide synthase [Streptomyces viridochromogenes]KOG17726.1 peptide synthetase [Streptomyces viridochromogenes]KOG18829.1 peptide synthetase [Streptomyces viridochromogenes]